MARRQIVLGIRRWVLVVSALTLGAAGIGTAVAKWHNRPIVIDKRPIVVQAPPPPAPTPPCADKAQIEYLSSGSWIQCDSRANLEVFPAGSSHVLFKCGCRRR